MIPGASAATSLCSLTWAISGYIKFKLNAYWGHQKSKWSALIIQLCWRGSLLASRITALVLAALCLQSWLFVFLGNFSSKILSTTLFNYLFHILQSLHCILLISPTTFRYPQSNNDPLDNISKHPF